MAVPRVSVVIPTLNEARNLPHVFANMPPDIHEVILVDGYSVDGTADVARALWPGIRVTTQTRTGKGNALACGFALASGDIIAAVDADGSADPAEIPRFVQALVDGADFAKGTRFAAGGGSNDLTRLRRAGNHLLTLLFNRAYGSRYSDLCYGFNVFWRRHAGVLRLDTTSPGTAGGTRLWGDGFEIETLIHVRAAQAGLIVAEVPSFEHARVHGASNLNAIRDGLRVLRTIMIERRAAQPKPGRDGRGRPERARAGQAGAGQAGAGQGRLEQARVGQARVGQAHARQERPERGWKRARTAALTVTDVVVPEPRAVPAPAAQPLLPAPPTMPGRPVTEEP